MNELIPYIDANFRTSPINQSRMPLSMGNETKSSPEESRQVSHIAFQRGVITPAESNYAVQGQVKIVFAFGTKRRSQLTPTMMPHQQA